MAASPTGIGDIDRRYQGFDLDARAVFLSFPDDRIHTESRRAVQMRYRVIQRQCDSAIQLAMV